MQSIANRSNKTFVFFLANTFTVVIVTIDFMLENKVLINDIT